MLDALVGEPPKCLEKHLLHHILGIVAVAEYSPRDALDGAPMQIDEAVKVVRQNAVSLVRVLACQ